MDAKTLTICDQMQKPSQCCRIHFKGNSYNIYSKLMFLSINLSFQSCIKATIFTIVIALICLWLASGFYLHIHFPLNLSRYVAYNTSHNSWDQSFSSHYQYCLLVSGTVSWHKLRCCYCSNMLQHWVGGETWFICEKWIILEFQETFARID